MGEWRIEAMAAWHRSHRRNGGEEASSMDNDAAFIAATAGNILLAVAAPHDGAWLAFSARELSCARGK